ncbi:mitochondrial carrier homolog 2 [Drosophila tropicalis]|uniref:mitochondrial carrier homolog 2 n=1 Tax=Drosophila tropicalis TaxID=46794 RepID=UPI0035AB70EE
MESNRRRRQDRLAAGAGTGMSIANGGGDADNDAEIRRQMEVFLMRMDGGFGEVDGDEDEEGMYDLYNGMDIVDYFDLDELEMEQDSEPMSQDADDISTGQVSTVEHEPNEYIRFCTRLTFSTLLYPYEYARILIQLGHEPMPSQVYQIWKLKPFVLLPGVHKYVEYIKRCDGFAGLYRGVVPRILGTTVGFLFSDVLVKLLRIRPYNSGPKELNHPFREYVWDLFRDSIRLATASVLSYPFHLVMVRQAAQFVGREKIFETLQSSVKHIFEQNGIMGFYAGFVPKLVAEMTVLVVTSTATHIFFRSGRDGDYYMSAVVQMVTTLATYPLEVASSCMACTGTPLAVGGPPLMPTYIDWIDCLSDLYTRGEHTRGIHLFWRTVPRFQISTGLLDGATYVRVP